MQASSNSTARARPDRGLWVVEDKDLLGAEGPRGPCLLGLWPAGLAPAQGAGSAQKSAAGRYSRRVKVWIAST